MHQKFRRLNFFDRHVVKQDGADIHPGIQKLNVSCAHGGSQSIWLGSKTGELHRLDRQFSVSPTLQGFDHDLVSVRVLDHRQHIVALGSDVGREIGPCTKIKIFDVHKEDDPQLTREHRVFSARSTDQTATCFDVSPQLNLVAVGSAAGGIQLFQARDLSVDKARIQVLSEDSGTHVTSVHFLEQKQRVVLFACDSVSVRSWSCDDDVRLLHVDTSGGASACCSCTFPVINALMVAKGEAIFAHDPDEGNMSAIPLEGEKLILTQFKSYFVAVTEEVAGLGTMPSAAHSSAAKQNVIVCLALPTMRFIGYSGQFTDVTHVFVGMGSVFVLSRGGADGTSVLFELREKELPQQLDILLKKRMFEWAADIGLREGSPSETIADIYRQHGDALFEKRAYDQALAVYIKTVELGLPLEPSYIVERYLDAQRIGHIAKYLKRLHERNMAEREHTALLLKCYTKLKDFGTLESFLETTPTSQYDPATAISVLEAASYYGLAADIARKVGHHEDYVRISLEHFKNYARTVEFLHTLPDPEASKILLENGRVLLKHAPKETVKLIYSLCCLSSDGLGPHHDTPHVDTFLPIFVDDLEELERFLRGILMSPTSNLQAEGERLFPTLLELMVRSHSMMGEPTPAKQTLSDEIMWLIRQHQSEVALASTLMLCQTYEFVDGLFFAAEKLGRNQLLMNWCFEQRDVRRLLDVCRNCGSTDQSLWVQALSFLASEGDNEEALREVLRHIEQFDLVPMLMVIETLQQNERITVDVARSYLQGQFQKLTESVESSRGKAKQDRQEIERMQQEIVDIRTSAQVFQNTKCFQCGLTLEVPAVHFFCGHSYHSYCMSGDGRCPKCSAEALPKIEQKEQREAQSRNTEDFFKYLQSGVGENGIQKLGEWCKFGAFDDGFIDESEL